VRETLFNWLQPYLPGSRCLDLFSGSGALGLEALSRGAEHVLFVDNSAPALRHIGLHLEKLQLTTRAATRREDALRVLAQPPAVPFDIAFVDPPFATGLLDSAVRLLEGHRWLTSGALVYLEQDSHDPWPQMPAAWQLHREGAAGQAAFRLVQWRL
jgi:16S rRNA (guanine966-N2)-methyltransferase